MYRNWKTAVLVVALSSSQLGVSAADVTGQQDTRSDASNQVSGAEAFQRLVSSQPLAVKPPLPRAIDISQFLQGSKASVVGVDVLP